MREPDCPQHHVRILDQPIDVARWVGDVQAAADRNKAALGFLPEGVYSEAAEQGKLLIATIQTASQEYAGHLLFGGVYPNARIFQVHVEERYRLRSIGRRLVESVVRKMERDQFLSVISQVAVDLQANSFWEKLQFETIRIRSGGKTTGRKINIRVRELNTPRLFSQTSIKPPVEITDLRLLSRLSNISPRYAIDLNVIYDVVKRRPRAEEAGRLMQASFDNLVRLAVTEEFIEELQRTSIPNPTDPILELALRLPRLPRPTVSEMNRVLPELAVLVFPDRTARSRLTEQDRSDLMHLASAIHNKVAGFITSEKAILRAREQLNSRYSIDIVGPAEFIETLEPKVTLPLEELYADSGALAIKVSEINEQNVDQLRQFLSRMSVPPPMAQEMTATATNDSLRGVFVCCDDNVTGFATWGKPTAIRPKVSAFICVDEDHAAVDISVDHLLNTMSHESSLDMPTQISLRLLPGQVATRRIAAGHGFRSPANEDLSSANLQKVSVGRFVTRSNWELVSKQLERAADITLPAVITEFNGTSTQLSIGTPAGQKIAFPLIDLETLLSPVLLILPSRSGAIVPIRRTYAAHLIGAQQQKSFLASKEAILLRERVYFSAPKTSSVLQEGTPILFYESGAHGGRASIIAGARVVRSELMAKNEVLPRLYRQAVLSAEELGEISEATNVLASTFDNLLALPKPVSIARLRQIHCADPANFITAWRITSEQFQKVLEEGTNL